MEENNLRCYIIGDLIKGPKKSFFSFKRRRQAQMVRKFLRQKDYMCFANFNTARDVAIEKSQDSVYINGNVIPLYTVEVKKGSYNIMKIKRPYVDQTHYNINYNACILSIADINELVRVEFPSDCAYKGIDIFHLFA
jgi:hypothetical protein